MTAASPTPTLLFNSVAALLSFHFQLKEKLFFLTEDVFLIFFYLFRRFLLTALTK